MWIAIFGIALILAISSVFYLLSRFKKFLFIRKLAGERKSLLWLFAALMLVPLIVYGWLDLVNAVIVMIHLAVFWLIADIIAAVVRRFRKGKSGGDDSGSEDADKAEHKKTGLKPYWLGLAVILITAAYLGKGWYNAHHVSITKYNLETGKELGTEKIRIVQITDSHVGNTFDGEGFAEHMKTVQELDPDIVVITGDYVDDDTTREDMIICSEALGQLKTKYGIYFIYGNHDRGYFNSRNFSADDLEAELRKNNVVILKDESVLVDDLFYVVGRKDASFEERESAQALTSGLDKSRYIIMLDHQPTDYDNEAEAGADIVLSGHTHGGQLIPLGFIGQYIIRANKRTYGIETRKDTTFIVSSGISDWAIDYKTGCFSEIVVIDIDRK